MFSQYSANKFEVEPVEVVSFDGKRALYPCLDSHSLDVDLDYITRGIGVSLEAKKVSMSCTP